jgi:glycerol-3-phosphate dehydrogenase subunit C
MSMTVTEEQKGKGEDAVGQARPMTPDAVRRTMDNCTKCNICQSHCPVALATSSFPGPKYAGPQAERFRSIAVAAETAPQLCSGCGVCTSVCPNDVAVTDIITLAKADLIRRTGGVSLGQRLLNRPDLIGRLGGLAPWLGNLALGSASLRRVAALATGISADAPLPRFAGRRFRRWLRHHTLGQGTPIAYFPGCAVEHYDPNVGIAAVKLLTHLGYKVTAPSSGCCSLPMLSSGDFDAARPRAETLINELAPWAAAGQTIVGTSTSCTLTVKSKYAAYLGFADGTAATVAGAVTDICGFLLDRHGDELAGRLTPVIKKVLYHGPCQLRGHHIGQPAVELLRLIPGIKLELSEASCCGVAGTYGYDAAKRDIAVKVGRSLMDQIARSKPDLVLCDSETCRWNIEQACGVPCHHPIQLMAEAMVL